MRTLRSLSLALSAALILSAAGCSEKSGVTEETKISGPGGTATITKDTKVETTGKNPPVVVEPSTSKAP